MKKLIFVTGLANGGKTTSIKSLLKSFGKTRTGSNIKINGLPYQVRDYSNCDVGWDNFVQRVKKYSFNTNLIYPLCLDIQNKKENYPEIEQIFDFLSSLKKDHILYFFIIKHGKDNRSLENEYIETLKRVYSEQNVQIVDNNKANNSEELRKFIERI